jgi:hypothetical protein
MWGKQRTVEYVIERKLKRDGKGIDLGYQKLDWVKQLEW